MAKLEISDSQKCSKTTRDTCDTRDKGEKPAETLDSSVTRSADRTCDSPNETRDNPPWADLDAWRFRLRHARDRDERTHVAVTWARAAGGTVVENGTLAVHLPDNLPHCLAAVELQRLARDCRLLGT